MLKNVPKNVSADLIKILMEMGHSDEIAIVDGNFPSGKHPGKVVHCIGLGVPEILESVLSLIPLDTYVDNPSTLMEVTPGDPYVPEIWDEFRKIGFKHEKDGLREVTIPRFDFYERTKNCYALITTSEAALYANIILKKGVL